MLIFHFLQNEHEVFFQYFSRLNVLHAQCVDQYSKMKIFEIILKGQNYEYWEHVEGIYHGV